MCLRTSEDDHHSKSPAFVYSQCWSVWGQCHQCNVLVPVSMLKKLNRICLNNASERPEVCMYCQNKDMIPDSKCQKVL